MPEVKIMPKTSCNSKFTAHTRKLIYYSRLLMTENQVDDFLQLDGLHNMYKTYDHGLEYDIVTVKLNRLPIAAYIRLHNGQQACCLITRLQRARIHFVKTEKWGYVQNVTAQSLYCLDWESWKIIVQKDVDVPTERIARVWKKLTEAKIRYRTHLAYTNLASQFIYSHRIVTAEEWVLLKNVVMNPRWGHRRISNLLKAKKELDKIKAAEEEADA